MVNMTKIPIEKNNTFSYTWLKRKEYELKQAFMAYVDAFCKNFYENNKNK